MKNFTMQSNDSLCYTHSNVFVPIIEDINKAFKYLMCTECVYLSKPFLHDYLHLHRSNKYSPACLL